MDNSVVCLVCKGKCHLIGYTFSTNVKDAVKMYKCVKCGTRKNAQGVTIDT